MIWAEENKIVCRGITAHPDPVVILATDQQLDDLERFACIWNAPPITMDPTFNLGEFYVTPITYRNLMLKTVRATAGFACFAGPLLIHYNKTYACYNMLFSELKKARCGLDNLSAFGTDGEGELIRALSNNFPSAKQLRCYHHFSNNAVAKADGSSHAIKTSLHELSICPKGQFEDYFEDILEKSERDLPKFAAFLLRTKQIIKDNFHVSNNNGYPFYTSSSESINGKIKQFMQHRLAQINNFLEAMVQFLKCEHCAALHGYIGVSRE